MNGPPRPATSSGRAVARTLDAVDRALIDELQRDGRASYASLAKIVGLSEAAVRQRVQRLLDTGVMQIVAITDPLTVNLARQAMIGITVDGDTREVAERLADIEDIEYVVLTAGGFDILCELICTDDDDLLELLNEKVRAIPGIRTTQSFVYLKLVKQTYTWGPRREK